VRPLTRQGGLRRETARVRREATTGLRSIERRGASARRGLQRKATRQRDQALRTVNAQARSLS
jgi:hypothetical protein